MKNILLVEDELELREMFKLIMNKHFKVTECTNGSEALQLLNDKKFDLIVSDYKMPVMNGLILLEKVRQLDPSIPFFLLTGSLDCLEKVEFSKYLKMATKIYLKPFQIKLFISDINNLFEQGMK